MKQSYGNCVGAHVPDAQLKSAVASHHAAVERFFNSSPELKKRLLLIDMESPTAGREVCDFVLGHDHARCQTATGVPVVDVKDLPRFGANPIFKEGFPGPREE